MNLDDLAKATTLKAELDNWRVAERRCEPAVFREAILRVVDMAHGHPGVNPQQQQNAETIIRLEPKHLLPYVRAHIDRLTNELRALGVEV